MKYISLVIVCICIAATFTFILHHYFFCKMYEVEGTVTHYFITGEPWALMIDGIYFHNTGIKTWGRRIFHIELDTKLGLKKLKYWEFKKDGETCTDINFPRLKMKILTSRWGHTAFLKNS